MTYVQPHQVGDAMNIRVTICPEAAQAINPARNMDSLEEFVGKELRNYYGPKFKSVKFFVGEEGRCEVDVPHDEHALSLVVDDAMTNCYRENRPYTGWKKHEMN